MSDGTVFASYGSPNSTIVPCSFAGPILNQPPAITARSRIDERPMCPGAGCEMSSGRMPMPSSQIVTAKPVPWSRSDTLT